MPSGKGPHQVLYCGPSNKSVDVISGEYVVVEEEEEEEEGEWRRRLARGFWEVLGSLCPPEEKILHDFRQFSSLCGENSPALDR